MRILFISSANMMATNLAYLMRQDGNEVKLFIDDRDRKDAFKGLVEHTNDWEKELDWVGKDGLIVFDDTGYGAAQEKLREKGYSVFGGCLKGDELESQREKTQRIFQKCGMNIAPTHEFQNIEETIAFIKKNPGAWVIKQNDDASKGINYVPRFDDGGDTLAMLESYQSSLGGKKIRITLQKRITGVEIATSRFFNGKDWVGPVELNVEHKRLFPGDLGPATSEMGTLAWYDQDSNNLLFKKTLGRLKPYLQEIGYRGVIDINCIVNKDGAFPLEATPRFGSPIVYLQTEMYKGKWAPLLKAVADGKSFNLVRRNGFGVVTLIAAPPFPYLKKIPAISPRNLPIYFDKTITAREMKHVHFEGVKAFRDKNNSLHYQVADDQGYILYVTAHSKNLSRARSKIRNIISKIYVPKMFYRNDIGLGFLKNGRRQLEAWRYL